MQGLFAETVVNTSISTSSGNTFHASQVCLPPMEVAVLKYLGESKDIVSKILLGIVPLETVALLAHVKVEQKHREKVTHILSKREEVDDDLKDTVEALCGYLKDTAKMRDQYEAAFIISCGVGLNRLKGQNNRRRVIPNCLHEISLFQHKPREMANMFYHGIFMHLECPESLKEFIFIMCLIYVEKQYDTNSRMNRTNTVDTSAYFQDKQVWGKWKRVQVRIKAEQHSCWSEKYQLMYRNMKNFCATQRAKWQDKDYVVKLGVTYNVKRVLESSLVEIATWDGLAQEFMEGQAMENALGDYQTRFIGMLMIMIIQETRGFTPKFMLWKKSKTH